MPSLPPSSRLARDIRALTFALAQLSAPTSPQPALTKRYFKHEHGLNANKTYGHITDLLTRDAMDDDQAEAALAGVAMHQHFALFAVHQAPPESPTPTATLLAAHDVPDTSETTTPPADSSTHTHTPADSSTHRVSPKCGPKDCTKIRFELVDRPQHLGDIEMILKTGLNAADLNQHVSDIKQILSEFSPYDLSEGDREARQTKCLIFFLQRSIEKLTQRFHNPRTFFSTKYTPWWRMLIQWNPGTEDVPVHEFSPEYHVVLIFNALSPDMMSFDTPTLLDSNIATKCVTGLAVLLDVIDGKLLACRKPTRSHEDWERLSTTLRMLYSLLYETDIIRYIFTNSSLSALILSLSKSAQFREDGDKHNGPFLLRQLEKVVAWQCALFILASTKVVRSAIPINFNFISVPPSSVEMTPIMSLVHEIYPSKRQSSLLKSHLTSHGVCAEKPDGFSSPHYNASLMGILMATDYREYSDVSAGDVGADPRKVLDMKEGILQVIVAGKKCCYACEKLASLLGLKNQAPRWHEDVFRPWSPPVGITQEVLTLLRKDLMDHFKRYLQFVVIEDESLRTREKGGSSAPFFWNMIETLNELSPESINGADEL
ncbi:hypothetical protein C8F04DRAFT_1229212 [Mycena alexandri]|uniref:Uncharacterized protein n=1 Tax=Mycena alexandri TaxID=1745969 RepID=A0AAD6XCW1_9AGAR|nr:hypothetical protein C8F04DRAFT_1229212 [Mycena alexandri]